jgi:hypothetical protein
MVARNPHSKNASPAIAPVPDERTAAVERWKRTRAMGRTTFIWRRGVFGWGVPVALVTIAYQIVQEQGFVRRLVMTQHLKVGVGIAMLVFPLCGYLFGRYLWTAGEENYERLVDRKSESATSERSQRPR